MTNFPYDRVVELKALVKKKTLLCPKKCCFFCRIYLIPDPEGAFAHFFCSLIFFLSWIVVLPALHREQSGSLC